MTNMATLPEKYAIQKISYTDPTLPKWSKLTEPPAVGSTVLVTMNQLGEAVVEGYEVVDGWLALEVRFVNPPAWWIKQV